MRRSTGKEESDGTARQAAAEVTAWLTSALVALAMFAPTAVQAAEIYIQKPGH